MARSPLVAFIIGGLFALALVLGALGSRVCGSYWQGLFANLATTTFGVGLAILIVNVLLYRAARRRTLAALTILTGGAITSLLSNIRVDSLKYLTKDQLLEILDNRTTSGRYVLDPGVCRNMAQRYRLRKQSYDYLLQEVRSDLRYLALMLGWSFDPDLLWQLFTASQAIRRFRVVRRRTDPSSDRAIATRLLDVYIYVGEVRTWLAILREESKLFRD